MSGYSQGYRKDVLNNEIWGPKAEELCQRIGHSDNAGPASHVEKQLMAYYLERHYLFDDDRCLLDSETWSDDGLGVSVNWLDALPCLPDAIITVSKDEKCFDCLGFESGFAVTAQACLFR